MTNRMTRESLSNMTKDNLIEHSLLCSALVRYEQMANNSKAEELSLKNNELNKLTEEVDELTNENSELKSMINELLRAISSGDELQLMMEYEKTKNQLGMIESFLNLIETNEDKEQTNEFNFDDIPLF